MTDDVFKLEEYGNFLFISANGKEVTGKFDSSHRTDLNWIVCVLNNYVNENVYWEKENEELKQKNTMLKIDLKHITDRKNYLESEWDKCYELIDKKIDKLEKKYEFGQNVVKTNCPMHNIQFGINVLKELRKELEE